MGEGHKLNFESLKLHASIDELRHDDGRHVCEACGRRCKYYCAKCVKTVAPLHPGRGCVDTTQAVTATIDSETVPAQELSTSGGGGLAGDLPQRHNVSFPQLSLPVKVRIIRHPAEKASKSSAIPLKLLCPKDVELFDFPEMPEFSHSSTVLMFPAEDAEDADRVEWSSVETIVFVDCTWFQTSGIMRNPALQSLRKVKLSNRETRFWRHQAVSKFCLATAEAVYYVMRDFYPAGPEGCWDNVLFFFALKYFNMADRGAADASLHSAEKRRKLREKQKQDATAQKARLQHQNCATPESHVPATAETHTPPPTSQQPKQ